MARANRMRFAIIAAAPVVTIAALAWFTGLIYRADYPVTPAVPITGLEEPSVDLAAIQRTWPAGVPHRVAKARLQGFMQHIEAAPVAPAVPRAILAHEPVVDLGTRLARADAEKGRRATRACASCHTFEPNGPHRIGPNLWSVVGRAIASRPGFAYSRALAAQRGHWSYAELDRFLASPARAVPGNKMAFPGIRQAQDRADVIAYLGSLAAQPLAYPPPISAAAEAAPTTAL